MPVGANSIKRAAKAVSQNAKTVEPEAGTKEAERTETRETKAVRSGGKTVKASKEEKKPAIKKPAAKKAVETVPQESSSIHYGILDDLPVHLL